MSRLYLRLLAWFCIANVLTLLMSVFLTERLARHAYGHEPDWARVAAEGNRAYDEGGRDGFERWRRAHREQGFEAALFEHGRNLSGRRPPLPPRLLAELLGNESVEVRLRPDLRVIGQSVTGANGEPRRFVALRHPPPPPRMEQLLAIQIVASLLVIGLVGWWQARAIARPVAAVGAAARAFAAGDLGARVAPALATGRDEIGELARDFDRMAARIQALVNQERGVLQDVSHELRSPLARLHLLLDLARRSTPEEARAHFARAEHEIEKLNRLIGDALALSRLENGLPGGLGELVAVDELLPSCVEASRLEADARGIVLRLIGVDAAADACTIVGDAVLLARAIDNLLSNAIKFSPDGAVIEVGLERGERALHIRVRDHGPGVPAEELERLFLPFYRGSNAAKAAGHGLGLAIVERIARAHRGQVSARNADGGGLEVRLSLPR